MSSKAFQEISQVTFPDLYPLLQFLNTVGSIVKGLEVNACYHHDLSKSGVVTIQPTAFITSSVPWALELTNEGKFKISGASSGVEFSQNGGGFKYEAQYSDEFGEAVVSVGAASGESGCETDVDLIYSARRYYTEGQSRWILSKLVSLWLLKKTLERTGLTSRQLMIDVKLREVIGELKEHVEVDLLTMSTDQIGSHINRRFPCFNLGDEAPVYESLESYRVRFAFVRLGSSVEFALQGTPTLQLVSRTNREKMSLHGLAFLRDVIGEPSEIWLVNTGGCIRQHNLTDDQRQFLTENLFHWGPVGVSLQGYVNAARSLLVDNRMAERIELIRESGWAESSLVPK